MSETKGQVLRKNVRIESFDAQVRPPSIVFVGNIISNANPFTPQIHLRRANPKEEGTCPWYTLSRFWLLIPNCTGGFFSIKRNNLLSSTKLGSTFSAGSSTSSESIDPETSASLRASFTWEKGLQNKRTNQTM